MSEHISEVFNEDCMIGMARYPDKYFDLAVVDPPYGINAHALQPTSDTFRRSTGRSKSKRLNGGGGKLKNRLLNKSEIGWDSAVPYEDYFSELFRVSQNQIIWGGNYFPLSPTRCIVIWDKCQPWENFSQIEMAWTSFDYPAKLYKIDPKQLRDKIHPTQKPIELYDKIITDFLPQGGKVIDTHLGSGSNRIAADKAGNIDFVGYELDKDYYEAQEKRWKGFKAQTRLF